MNDADLCREFNDDWSDHLCPECPIWKRIMNNNISNEQLQLLTKMLPDEIVFKDGYLWWTIPSTNNISAHTVKPTEYIELCWRAEETLTLIERDKYIDQLYYFLDTNGSIVEQFENNWTLIHDSLSQKITALAKVKGLI